MTDEDKDFYWDDIVFNELSHLTEQEFLDILKCLPEVPREENEKNK